MKKSIHFASLILLFAASMVHAGLHAQVNLNKGAQIVCNLDSSGQNTSVNRLPQTDFHFQQISYSKGFDGTAFGAPYFYGNSHGRMERGPQTDQVTFSFWFNTNAAQKESVLLGWDKKGYGASLALGGKVNVYAHLPNNQAYTYDHNQNLADGKWHNVIGVFDCQLFAVWIDGRKSFEDRQYGAGKKICYEAAGLNLGALPKQADPKYYTGLLDEVLLYNRALSDQEIEIIANRGKLVAEDDLTNPIVYLPFEQNDLNVSPNLTKGTEITAYGGSFANNNCNNGAGLYMKNLDDGNGYLTGGPALEVPRFTLSFWLSTHTVKESFVAGWDTTGYRIVLNPKGKNGKLQAQIWTSPSETLVLTAPETLNDGVCRFITLSFDGQAAKLFIDGNLKEEKKVEAPKTATTSTGVFHAASMLLVGREREQNPQMQYLGTIDEVRLYNRALTSAEVKSLMAPPLPSKPVYRVYETSGYGPAAAFLAASNPTGRDVTLVVLNAGSEKIAQHKMKPGEHLLKPLPAKNLKIVWK